MAFLYIPFHCFASPCIALHCFALRYIIVHCSELPGIACHFLQYPVCIALCYILLHYFALLCIALHYFALPRITLHRFAMLYTALMHCSEKAPKLHEANTARCSVHGAKTERSLHGAKTNRSLAYQCPLYVGQHVVLLYIAFIICVALHCSHAVHFVLSFFLI